MTGLSIFSGTHSSILMPSLKGGADNPANNENEDSKGTARQSGLFSMGFCGIKDRIEADNKNRARRIRELVRDLKREKDRKGAGESIEDHLKLSGSEKKEKDNKVKEPVNYSYKEVSSKIQNAKTSVSAGQALLSARRKVLEIKRKISAGKGDPEELELALTHAKRMEIVARRKKHHLELEEMAEYHLNNEEEREKDGSSDVRGALISAEEERINEEEDKIFEEREDILKEETEGLKESGTEAAGLMMSELNEMISEFGEEELKELEDSMEMLEDMEVIDPHMSREKLSELKRKHRSDESKAMVKADMDYLKDMITHLVEKGGGIPVPEGASVDLQL